jgi:hypothetical protein
MEFLIIFYDRLRCIELMVVCSLLASFNTGAKPSLETHLTTPTPLMIARITDMQLRAPGGIKQSIPKVIVSMQCGINHRTA